MLNFETNTTAYTTSTRATRNSNYTTFTSKKKLIASNFLQAEQLAYVTNIVGLFTTAIHNSKQYAVCTLWRNSAYSYIVINLQNGSIASVASVAIGKNEVEQLVCNTTPDAPSITKTSTSNTKQAKNKATTKTSTKAK